jgi:hypothetical protein
LQQLRISLWHIFVGQYGALVVFCGFWFYDYALGVASRSYNVLSDFKASSKRLEYFCESSFFQLSAKRK